MRFMTPEADGPAPPVQEIIRGLKVAFSTFLIRCSYFSFLKHRMSLVHNKLNIEDTIGSLFFNTVLQSCCDVDLIKYRYRRSVNS